MHYLCFYVVNINSYNSIFYYIYINFFNIRRVNYNTRIIKWNKRRCSNVKKVGNWNFILYVLGRIRWKWDSKSVHISNITTSTNKTQLCVCTSHVFVATWILFILNFKTDFSLQTTSISSCPIFQNPYFYISNFILHICFN